MRHRNAVQFQLRNVELFSACTDKELDLIARSTTRLSFDAGTVMAREGHVGGEFFAIVEGHVRVEVRGGVIATVREGDFFGEIALLDGGPRTATVIAETPVVAEVIGKREFDGVLEGAPHMARRLLVGLARRLRAADLHLVA